MTNSSALPNKTALSDELYSGRALMGSLSPTAKGKGKAFALPQENYASPCHSDSLKSEFLCQMCFDPKPKGESFTINGCSHSYCNECIANHIGTQLQKNMSQIYCPARNCSGLLEPHNCRAILPAEVFDRWENTMSESLILSSEKFYCPFEDCSVMLIADGEDTIRESECPYCRRLFCAQCKVPWHAEISCQELQKLLKDGIKMEDIKLMKKPEFLCQICCDEKPEDHSFSIKGCSHSYCKDCVANYVSSKVQENVSRISCPVPECSGLLEPDYCRWILSDEVFDRWGNTLCEAWITGSQKLYCPYKDCSAMLVDDGGDTIRESECPNCNRLFCAQCKVPWHGDFECEEFQKLGKNEREREDMMLMKLAKNKQWRRCPKCNIFVERTEGCSFMTCRCRAYFCYACGAEKTSASHGYYCSSCKA